MNSSQKFDLVCKMHGKGEINESLVGNRNDLLNIEVSLHSRDADSEKEHKEKYRYLIELRNEQKLNKVTDDLKRTLLWHELAKK